MGIYPLFVNEKRTIELLHENCAEYVLADREDALIELAEDIKARLSLIGLGDCYKGLIKNLDKQREQYLSQYTENDKKVN